MGLFFWKRHREIDVLGRALADDLYSHVQPDMARRHAFARGIKNKKKKRAVEQKFIDIMLQMDRFVDANSLGIYGKARLQKKFNDRLEELGYEPDLVSRIAEMMLLRQ